MINWLTNKIGTGAYLEVAKEKGDFSIVDVTNLVDKDGNSSEAILQKISESVDLLKSGSNVVICCDYGMSRSNSIAVGVITIYEEVSFFKATDLVQKKISVQGIKMEVINSVYNAMYPNLKAKTSINERILITGVTGFIGSRLMEKFGKLFFTKGISSKEIDLINNPILLDLFVKENEITTLIHLANPRVYTINAAMGSSLVMLRNVLEICKLNSIRLIYISSWEIYSGYKAQELIADESLPAFPKGSYGESKWLAEQLIVQYQRTCDLKYVIVRSSPIFGENSDKPKFIYNFIDKARRNELIITHKYLNGFPKLDLLNVDDFIIALERIISCYDSTDFNLGSGEITSTPYIAELIIKKLGSSSRLDYNLVEGYSSNIKMNYDKAQKILKWKPILSFETGIEKLLK